MQLHREGHRRNRINLDERSPLVSNLRRNNCLWLLDHYLRHRNRVAFGLHAYRNSARCNRLNQFLRHNLGSQAHSKCYTELNRRRPNVGLLVSEQLQDGLPLRLIGRLRQDLEVASSRRKVAMSREVKQQSKAISAASLVALAMGAATFRRSRHRCACDWQSCGRSSGDKESPF
jgi:hypothetical protein